MSENLKAAINDLVSELAKQLAEVSETKKVINTLCRRVGDPPMYPDDEDPEKVSGRSIERDQFYGRPLATVVRELIEMRGPRTAEELVNGLTEGDFDFGEWKDHLKAKNLAISLSKNPQFLRLPSGRIGLKSKYSTAKPRDNRKGGSKDDGQADSSQGDLEDATDEKG